ncbi:2-epi-5-epi-valiolone synthase, partial [bacterium]|nr:2-epi-5-epi-valiolone synthase [bacterium]
DWENLVNTHCKLLMVPTNLNESNKGVDSLLACLERIENYGFSRRNDILLAIGGGTLMDLISLAANLYRRGIAVYKVPTTLLGFVDASVGIKTGINFLSQRNRLGTYYLNYNVIYDCSLLTSLSMDLIREGLGEIFKIALIKSSELFLLLELNENQIKKPEFYLTNQGKKIISISIQLMLEELHDNPNESNLKRCVDFGHSFSPLLEMESIKNKNIDSIPHGLAVGADSVITSIIAFNRKLIDKSVLKRIFKLATLIDFLAGHELYKKDEIMWSSMMEMTVHRNGSQNLPVPISIGSYTFLQDLTYDEMRKATKVFRESLVV